MKVILAILLILLPGTELDKIAKENKAKKEAEDAYLAKNYKLASEKYQYLLDSLGAKDERARLNWANAQYHLKDTAAAMNNYRTVAENSNKIISSLARQQLGELNFEKKKYKEALTNYKQALKLNPGNNDARYNYELLKKIIKQQEQKQKNNQNKDQKNKDKDQKNKDQKNKNQQNKKKQNQDQKNKEQQNKNQQNKDQQQKDQQKQNNQQKKDGQKKDQQNANEQNQEKPKDRKPMPTPADKLKKMNISEEKAKMILEAMKNNEIQYIQQNKRKAKKKKDNSKPDW